jgi:predicted protein tyrosine phosphatase
MICVCSLFEMPDHVRVLRPSHLVSLVAPDEQPATPPEMDPALHLRISMHDICDPRPGEIVPDEEHLRSLVEFVATWEGERPLLLHCVAGISRSTAAALVALVLEHERRELEAARLLRRLAPHAWPNRRMIALADRLLGREGRLIEAREAMGPATPLASAPLVRIPRFGAPLPVAGREVAATDDGG